MTIDLASAAPEDLQPIAALMLATPLEKRGEIQLRVQRAARDFLAKGVDAQRVAAAGETDTVRCSVFTALAKQLPAPAPTIDPLKREALGTLVKAVTAGAKASLEKGLASAIGAKLGIGRAAGMAAMRAGARAGRRGAEHSRKWSANEASKFAYNEARNPMMPVGGTTGRPIRHPGVSLTDEAGTRYERVAGGGNMHAARAKADAARARSLNDTKDLPRVSARNAAARARDNFNWQAKRRVAGAASAVGAGAAAGGAAFYASGRSARRKNAEKAIQDGDLRKAASEKYGEIDTNKNGVGFVGRAAATLYGTNPAPVYGNYRGYKNSGEADKLRRKLGGSPKKTPKDLDGRGARIMAATSGAGAGAGIGGVVGRAVGGRLGLAGRIAGGLAGQVAGGVEGGKRAHRLVRDAQLYRRDFAGS